MLLFKALVFFFFRIFFQIIISMSCVIVCQQLLAECGRHIRINISYALIVVAGNHIIIQEKYLRSNHKLPMCNEVTRIFFYMILRRYSIVANES